MVSTKHVQCSQFPLAAFPSLCSNPRVTQRNVFLTGGTGYMGTRLIPLLLARGHKIRALVRQGSENKLPAGCEIVIGNALEKESFAAKVQPSDTFVQLVGVAHPSPSKGEQFRAIDLASAR